MIWGERRIETVARIDYALLPYAWAFAEDRAKDIDAHWEELRARKPRLFNGRVLLMHDYHISEDAGGRVLQAAGFETDYKAFLAWRDFDFPDRAVMNCFSMAALRSADGAFMLGEMGEHTANTGKLYFAAGTPDPSDVTHGKIDLEGSALRELSEETGIAADEVTLSPDWTLVFEGPRLACMKPAQARLGAKALVARCAAFLASDPEPELDRLVPVFSGADFDPAQMPPFMLDYLGQYL